MSNRDDDDDEEDDHQAAQPPGQGRLSGYRASAGERWLRHRVEDKDTLAHLALKYNTSIGQICRANGMQWQDVVQARRYIWLPVAGATGRRPAGEDEPPRRKTLPRSRSQLPPHFYRHSVPNTDDFASETDPLLICSRH